MRSAGTASHRAALVASRPGAARPRNSSVADAGQGRRARHGGAGPAAPRLAASLAQQLYGRYLSVEIREAFGVMWMSLFWRIQLPKLCQLASLMQPVFIPAGGVSSVSV